MAHRTDQAHHLELIPMDNMEVGDRLRRARLSVADLFLCPRMGGEMDDRDLGIRMDSPTIVTIARREIEIGGIEERGTVGILTGRGGEGVGSMMTRIEA